MQQQLGQRSEILSFQLLRFCLFCRGACACTPEAAKTARFNSSARAVRICCQVLDVVPKYSNSVLGMNSKAQRTRSRQANLLQQKHVRMGKLSTQ